MAGVIQEGLDMKAERYEFSIIQYKREPKSFAFHTEKTLSIWELGHMVNFEFSWNREPVPWSQDMASGVRRLLPAPQIPLRSQSRETGSPASHSGGSVLYQQLLFWAQGF